MWCSVLKRHVHREYTMTVLDDLKLVERAAFHQQIAFKIFQTLLGSIMLTG